MTLDKNKKILSERLKYGKLPICQTCNKIISIDRLLLVPLTNTCVDHSVEAGYIGVPNFSHKTAPEIAMVKSDNEEAVRQLWRGYNRSR